MMSSDFRALHIQKLKTTFHIPVFKLLQPIYYIGVQIKLWDRGGTLSYIISIKCWKAKVPLKWELCHAYVRTTYLAEYFHEAWKFAKISKKSSFLSIYIVPETSKIGSTVQHIILPIVIKVAAKLGPTR